MKCLFCKVDNAARNFACGRTPSNLTMFRLAVDRLEDGLVEDVHLYDHSCIKHQSVTEQVLFENFLVIKSQASVKQEVAAFITVRS